MTDYEHANDGTLTLELRDALAEVAVPRRPQLAEIRRRGRARQQRRLAAFAGLALAGVAAGTALALSLTGVLGAAQARSTAASRTAPSSGDTGTIQTAAFTLTSNANGTDTLRLTHGQMFNPAALQQALAQHDIPALVKIDAYCSSNPAPPNVSGVLTLERLNGTRLIGLPARDTPAVDPSSGDKAVARGDLVADDIVTVINPAAISSGTELFFGYFNSDHLLATHLIYTSSYTCSSGQPAATP